MSFTFVTTSQHLHISSCFQTDLFRFPNDTTEANRRHGRKRISFPIQGTKVTYVTEKFPFIGSLNAAMVSMLWERYNAFMYLKIAGSPKIVSAQADKTGSQEPSSHPDCRTFLFMFSCLLMFVYVM